MRGPTGISRPPPPESTRFGASAAFRPPTLGLFASSGGNRIAHPTTAANSPLLAKTHPQVRGSPLFPHARSRAPVGHPHFLWHDERSATSGLRLCSGIVAECRLGGKADKLACTLADAREPEDGGGGGGQLADLARPLRCGVGGIAWRMKAMLGGVGRKGGRRLSVAKADGNTRTLYNAC